jgi:hypothetical protein
MSCKSDWYIPYHPDIECSMLRPPSLSVTCIHEATIAFR